LLSLLQWEDVSERVHPGQGKDRTGAKVRKEDVHTGQEGRTGTQRQEGKAWDRQDRQAVGTGMCNLQGNRT